ncbi:uncharacterized protein [Penaeus vannamei]|uniref:uncharacterized protein n=1 Tax=Penaeus vannamei TaxID=6689 RepID=UPI00387F5D19
MDKEQFIRKLAVEVEGHFLVNYLRPAYQALRKLNSKYSSQRLQRHLGAINKTRKTFPRTFVPDCNRLIHQQTNLEAVSVETQLPDPPISEDPPSLTEIRRAISKLKTGKAAGICGIPAEMLKAGGEPMTRDSRAVLAAV